jgi:hypothetical protein
VSSCFLRTPFVVSRRRGFDTSRRTKATACEPPARAIHAHLGPIQTGRAPTRLDQIQLISFVQVPKPNPKPKTRYKIKHHSDKSIVIEAHHPACAPPRCCQRPLCAPFVRCSIQTDFRRACTARSSRTTSFVSTTRNSPPSGPVSPLLAACARSRVGAEVRLPLGES